MCEVCNGFPGCPCCSEQNYELCSMCDGDGMLTDIDDEGREYTEKCPVCDGTGYIDIEHDNYYE